MSVDITGEGYRTLVLLRFAPIHHDPEGFRRRLGSPVPISGVENEKIR